MKLLLASETTFSTFSISIIEQIIIFPNLLTKVFNTSSSIYNFWSSSVAHFYVFLLKTKFASESNSICSPSRILFVCYRARTWYVRRCWEIRRVYYFCKLWKRLESRKLFQLWFWPRATLNHWWFCAKAVKAGWMI